MTGIVNLVAEADLSDGLLAVVEDSLNKDVYHVYKKDKNVQPNHDAKGVMRYLMHVLHALGYRADKAEKALEEEQAKNKVLEAKVKLLEQLVCSVPKSNPIDEDVVLYSDQASIVFTNDERTMFHFNNQPQGKQNWLPVKTPQEALDIIYKEIK